MFIHDVINSNTPHAFSRYNAFYKGVDQSSSLMFSNVVDGISSPTTLFTKSKYG